MEQTQDQSAQNPQQAEEKKSNLASRALVATAFGVLLAGKVNNIGTIMDANKILKNRTLGQKVVAVFNGELAKGLYHEFKKAMGKNNKGVIATTKGAVSATSKVFKHTLITSGIGAAIGGGLGWALGGRIDDWHDIFKHPWESTKIMFEFKRKPSEEAAVVAAAQQEEKKPAPQENNTKWQDYAKERQLESAAMGKAV